MEEGMNEGMHEGMNEEPLADALLALNPELSRLLMILCLNNP